MRYEQIATNENGEQVSPFSVVIDAFSPSVNEDSTKDYNVGSSWINSSSGRVYELLDNTAGAAVWDWINPTASPHDLDFHTDVTIDTPLRNQMLRYNDATSQWENKKRYESQVIVQSLDDLPTPVGSDIFLLDLIYVIDGDIDITGYTLCFGAKTQINGLAQNVSIIRSSTNGVVGTPYVFFQSTANLFMNDIEVVCEGTNQLVFEHIGDGISVPEGESFELNRFNLLSFPAGGPPLWGHNNQMGYIKDIRQGFIGTFSAFGFENGFICAGAWAGGFRVQNTLFRVFEGVAFGSDPLDPVSFQLRMASEANLSIPLGSIGYDFPETAFSFTGQYQLQGGNVSGDGVYVSDFTSGFPAFDKLANFKNNTGIQNTFQGGEWVNDLDLITTINAVDVWEQVNLSTSNKFMTWFTELNGVFTYVGGNPLDVEMGLEVTVTGKANDIVEVKLVKEDALFIQTDILFRPITIKGTLAQGRAESIPLSSTEQLIEGDKILVYIRNTSGTSDVTLLAKTNCRIKAK